MNCVNGKTRNECFKTTSYSPTPAFGFSRIFHAILPIRYKIETSTQGGPVAQRLEQRTHNPLVPGSNPGGPTKHSREFFNRLIWEFFASCAITMLASSKVVQRIGLSRYTSITPYRKLRSSWQR